MILLALLLTAGLPEARAQQAPDPKLADYYGFLPLEIYPLGDRIAGLTTGDWDGDGTDDLAVINNARSRIDLLLSSPGRDERQTPGNNADRVNQLTGSQRFRLVTIPVNQEVVSLVRGDFDGDDRPDLAFYGEPEEIVVLANRGDGRFDSIRRLACDEAISNSNALATADLDGDDRDDLALLTEDQILLYRQEEPGRFAVPERIAHGASNPRILRLEDLDGDRRNDLFLFNVVRDDPLRVRINLGGGRFGPERRFPIEPGRAYELCDLDGRPGVELLNVTLQTGRVELLGLTVEPDTTAVDRPRVEATFYPLPRGGRRGRDYALGDLDGDRRTDLVVSDPINARLLVYRQADNGDDPGDGVGINLAETYPGLIDGQTVRLADLDGDGLDELFLISPREKIIGRCRFNDGRLELPEALPTQADPLAFDLGDFDGDGSFEIAYITESDEEGSNARFRLRALTLNADGAFVPYRWAGSETVSIDELRATPSALRMVDVDADGRDDALVFKAFGSPVLLLSRGNGAPQALTNLGPLAAAEPQSLSRTTFDGRPALIVAQNNLARDVRLTQGGRWQIRAQFNAGERTARIEGAVPLDLDGDGSDEIVLWDRGADVLRLLDRSNPGDPFRPAGQIPIGDLEFLSLQTADFDGDDRPDILVAGAETFALVRSGREPERFDALARYELPREDGRISDLVVDDINDDGLRDLLLIDAAENAIEIVAVFGPDDLRRAMTFEVFEEKSFSPRDLIEPRQIATGDFDGDNRTDFALIVHDRVLIYRQDSGPEADAEE